MGLFDAFKKKKKEESKEEENLDIYDIDGISSLSNSRKQERLLEQEKKELENRKKHYNEETEKDIKEFFEFANTEQEQMQKETEKIIDSNMRTIANFDERLKQTDNLPGTIRTRNVAAEEYHKIFEEVKEEKNTKSFEEKHEQISKMYSRLSLGLIPSNFDETQKKKYMKLSKEKKDDLLIPYLIEKIYSGIDDDKTIKDLKERIRDKGEKIQEQYTSGVELLQSFGLIDITDPDCFSASFKQYSLKTRDEIKTQNELSQMFSETEADSFQKGDSNIK